MRVDVDISEITSELSRLSKFDIATKLLDWGQEMLLREIKKRANYDTGQYRNAFKQGKIKKETAEIVTPMGQLLIWLEETGTKPHIITPKKARVLHWVNEGGQDIFAMRVRHPGTKATPHITPAIKHFIPEWHEYIFTQLKTKYEWLR